MATIIYSILGEGMGHALRSKPLLDELKKKNKIIILSSGRAYSFLKEHFDDVREIRGVFMYYQNNTVDEIKTITQFVLSIPKIIKSFLEVKKIIRQTKPKLIISDYEPIAIYASGKIPVINIDNQHIISKVKLKIQGDWFGKIETILVNKAMVPKGKKIVTSFFNNNDEIVGPILRKKIQWLKPKKGKKIFVYQTSNTNTQLIEVLKTIPFECTVYGFNREEKVENLTFKKFNETQFFEDLASAKAVIMNGGYTLMSEALFLRKPILSIPIKRQFEQKINAHYLDQLKWGMNVSKINAQSLKKFLENSSYFEKNIPKIDPGNKKVLKIINDQLS